MPPDPKVLLEQGAKHMKAKQFAEACKAFDEANKVDPKVATQLKLADCREKNGQLASALAAYKDAQPKATTAKDFKLVKAKIAALEPKVSTIRLTIPDASMVEGLSVTRDGVVIADTQWNTDLPVDGGTYKLEATAPNRIAWSESATVVNEGEHVTVRVPVLEAVPPPPPPEPAPEPPKPAPPPPPAPVVPPPPVVEEPSLMVKWTTITPRRKIALGIAGAGVVGITVAIVLGIQANNRYDESRELCPDLDYPCTNAMRAQELNDSARTRALGANLLWFAGGAAIIGAGILWYKGMPESKGVAIAPTISNRDASLAIVGSF